MRVRRALLLIYFASVQFVFADQVGVSVKDFEDFQKKTTLSKYDWLKQFSVELQDEFCSSKSYFSKCSELKSGQNCKDLFSTFFNQCVQKSEIPSQIQIYQNGIQLGMSLGSCVESHWKSSPQIHMKESQDCQQRRVDEK